MVEEGVATPAQIDEVVSNSFGFRLPFFGPFAIADIAGLDVYAGGFATLERAFGERLATPEVLRRVVADGRLGVKSGRGFHDRPGRGAGGAVPGPRVRRARRAAPGPRRPGSRPGRRLRFPVTVGLQEAGRCGRLRRCAA